MLHDLLLSFATTNPRMATITRPLLAATIPMTGVELSVSGRSTTEGLHSTTVVHLLHLLLVMTVVSLWMIAR